jgi:universal stress protein A
MEQCWPCTASGEIVALGERKEMVMKTKIRSSVNRVLNDKTANGRKSTRLPRTGTRNSASELIGIRSILVPTDFSARSEKALAFAIPLARKFGAKLTLMHVVEPIATHDFDGSFPLVLDNEKTKRFCESVLKQIVEKLEIEPPLLEKILVRHGRPFNEISDAARTLKVDLIVIATHGYTGLKHTFLGSTAERVARHAPCPVLVVRSGARTLGTEPINRQTKELV